jgi:hypothetical protein
MESNTAPTTKLCALIVKVARSSKKVIHLGEQSTAESALESWPQEIQELERSGRPKKAKTLQRKLDKLQEVNEEE